MNIIELAKQSGFWQEHANTWMCNTNAIEAFASLARAAALDEAASAAGEFAQKWWSIHCASNKHMETTRKAHDDFCALQAAIRALKIGDQK